MSVDLLPNQTFQYIFIELMLNTINEQIRIRDETNKVSFNYFNFIFKVLISL